MRVAKPTGLFIVFYAWDNSFWSSARQCQVRQDGTLNPFVIGSYVLFLRSSSRGFTLHSPIPTLLPIPTPHSMHSHSPKNKYPPSQNNSNKTNIPQARDQRERVASASQDHHPAKSIIYLVSKKPYLPFGLIIIWSRRDPICPRRGLNKFDIKDVLTAPLGLL